jgi:hypothetical protein
MSGSEHSISPPLPSWAIDEPLSSVPRWDLWQPGMAYVDFTNPDACKWYAKQLEGLMDIGVDTFKVSRCKPPEAGVISR